MTIEACPSCESQNISKVIIKDHKFGYGQAPNTITLNATVPVIECAACGEWFTDQGYEEACDAAVAEYKRKNGL